MTAGPPESSPNHRALSISQATRVLSLDGENSHVAADRDSERTLVHERS
jgi:hypothetical protein